MYLSTVLLTVFVSIRVAYAQTRSVFAHFMAQNSYSYSQEDWTNDIATAQSIGIDGFALNIAARDYEIDRIVQGYAAAEAANFKFFYSFDLNYNWQEVDIVEVVMNHADSPSTFRWGEAVLVSTFNGEGKTDAFWAGVKNSLSSRGVTISFAPAFIGYRDPARASELASSFPSIDGFFNWWSWPADNGELVTPDTDLAYKNALAGRSGPYIMSVSPWQFKNLGGDQNWVQFSDTLWNYRWQQAINDVQPDIVEIVTWNDYAESHYIGEINPKVDLGQLAPLYVNGMIHSPWRIVGQYYIQYFKTGTAPTIAEDRVVFWYRIHPKDVTCSQGGLPRNVQYQVDAVFALAMLSSEATVSLDIGSNHEEFTAGPGLTMGQIAFPVEDQQTPHVAIIRQGATVKEGSGPLPVTNACNYYNFNPIVGVVE